MSELTLSEPQRSALLSMVAAPGLALSLDTYADACDAALWLRTVKPGVTTSIDDNLLTAIRAGAALALSRGAVGASEEGRWLLTMIGLPVRPAPSATPET